MFDIVIRSFNTINNMVLYMCTKYNPQRFIYPVPASTVTDGCIVAISCLEIEKNYRSNLPALFLLVRYLGQMSFPRNMDAFMRIQSYCEQLFIFEYP